MDFLIQNLAHLAFLDNRGSTANCLCIPDKKFALISQVATVCVTYMVASLAVLLTPGHKSWGYSHPLCCRSGVSSSHKACGCSAA